jgi:hypothetical protein
MIPKACSSQETEQNVVTFAAPTLPDLRAELKHEVLLRADAPLP